MQNDLRQYKVIVECALLIIIVHSVALDVLSLYLLLDTCIHIGFVPHSRPWLIICSTYRIS